jgi:hypothetical protein
LELAFFVTLFYILFVEWKRTRRNELQSKLIAVTAAITQIVVTSLDLGLELFWQIHLSERFLPIFVSTLTITTIIFLWHAFLFSSAGAAKRRVGRFIIIFLVVSFAVVLALWNWHYRPGMHFTDSLFYLFYEIFFIVVDAIIIYTISRFKSKYKSRVITGFFAMMLLHGINIYGYTYELTSMLRFVRTGLPIVVPMMFGSVMYKELLDHLVNLNHSLRSALKGQGDLIISISEMDYTLNSLIAELQGEITTALAEDDPQKSRETLAKIAEEFGGVQQMLSEIDEKVFATMKTASSYNDVILR